MALSNACAVIGRHIIYRNASKSFDNSRRVAIYLSQKYSTTTTTISTADASAAIFGHSDDKPKKKLSNAMKAYLQRAQEHNEFMERERKEYQIGKRHLANMMGMNPDAFTQDDVNKAIEYLFPSGLHERRARPIMEDPEKIFPSRKEAQFDETGRPFHLMFYTLKPNFYEALYNIVEEMEKLDKIENNELRKGLWPNANDKMYLLGTEWMTKNGLEALFLENIQDKHYSDFITAIQRLADHPYSNNAKNLIEKYLVTKIVQTDNMIMTPLEYDAEGRPFVIVKRSKRKTAIADVKILGNGTGKITINGQDITYFKRLQHREQVSYFRRWRWIHNVKDEVAL